MTAVAAVCWALLAFGAGLYNRAALGSRPQLPVSIDTLAGVATIVTAVGPSAWETGIEPGDLLISIDGMPTQEAYPTLRSRLRPGESNSYRFRKPDGTELVATLEPAPPGPSPALSSQQGLERWSVPLGLAVPLFAAAIYFATGFIVWRLRPEREEAWALLLFCCSVTAELAMSGPQSRLTWTMNWVNAPLLGATGFQLFTTYPVEPDWVVRHRRVRLLPYLAGLCLSLLALAAVPLHLSTDAIANLILFFTVASFGSGLVALTFERRRLRSTEVRDRVDLVLFGAFVSFAPIVTLVLAQVLLQVVVPWFFSLLFVFVFPLCVAYGIVRKQLFEIRMVAKSSVAYGAASVAITGLFAVLVTSADALVGGFNVNARSPWFSVTFLFVAILAFNPLRVRLQGLVDQVFDRDRAAYRRAVREISEAMVSMLSIKEVVDRILVAVTDTMGVERALVLLLDEEERKLVLAASRGEWEPEALSVELAADHPIGKQLWMRREELSRLDFEDEPDPEVRDACRDVFDTMEVELLVPILFGVDLLGVIGVGRKLSGERLGADDRQLLRTLANQSSIAIENAKAFDEIAKLNETLEARVEQRTAELQETQAQLLQSEKMRSLGQLVAGVAHEINNPIGFVHANLQLLHEYVEKLLAAQGAGEDPRRLQEVIEKLLTRSREGTERVKEIVADLRTFSRMDQAELSEVDLNEEIDRTLTLMEPRLKDGITVERDYGKLPRVRCYAGQLNQVFLNLVMNACDAMEGRGAIRIRTRPRGSGVRLEFSDEGPGIAPEVQDRVFEPFFTTKAVGQGTGLGLSLSHGIVERHGGRMFLGSAPGQGTTFVIELPLDAPEEDPTPPFRALVGRQEPV